MEKKESQPYQKPSGAKTSSPETEKIVPPKIEKEEKEKKPSLKDHKNPVVRFFAKFAFSVWMIVMGVGLLLALVVSFMLL